MKLLRILLAVTALAWASGSALAQQYVTGIAIPGGTNNVAAATTNSSAAFIIPAVRSDNLSIQPVFKLTGSGTSAVVFKFDHSLDATNWVSSGLSVSVTAAGTATVTTISNLSVTASGWLKLTTIENPNASAVTNLTVIYASKRER